MKEETALLLKLFIANKCWVEECILFYILILYYRGKSHEHYENKLELPWYFCFLLMVEIERFKDFN